MSFTLHDPSGAGVDCRLAPSLDLSITPAGSRRRQCQAALLVGPLCPNGADMSLLALNVGKCLARTLGRRARHTTHPVCLLADPFRELHMTLTRERSPAEIDGLTDGAAVARAAPPPLPHAAHPAPH